MFIKEYGLDSANVIREEKQIGTAPALKEVL